MIRAEADDAALLERAAAEAFDAGAVGLEEHDRPAALDIYVSNGAVEAVGAALARLVSEGLRLAEPRCVEAVDWSTRWREGLAPIVVSPRLVVRPSFLAAPVGAAQQLLIDPGQAFGTGSHGSTLRALEWLDRLALEGRLAGARVLDVGCGTGVLGLAALLLGAFRAWGCDLDPLATLDARSHARANAQGERFFCFTGPVEAVAGHFDVVLANLLRGELLPILPELVAHLEAGGVLILSGLLEREEDDVSRALRANGLRVCGASVKGDAAGDSWLGLRAERSRQTDRRKACGLSA